MEGVSAITDVTGFGLLGHLLEVCEGSNVGAVIDYDKVPVFPEVQEYIELKQIPGGTKRNWQSYGEHADLANPEMRTILCDAQTSGGLLIAVLEAQVPAVKKMLEDEGLFSGEIGRLTEYNGGKRIVVK
jgi:selenide,water dikinase